MDFTRHTVVNTTSTAPVAVMATAMLTLGVSASVFAQDAPSPDQSLARSYQSAYVARLYAELATVDANSDGTLDDSERSLIDAEAAAGLFGLLPLDAASGRAVPPVWVVRMHAVRLYTLAVACDRNGDGDLDPAEREGLTAWLSSFGAGPPWARRGRR